MINFKNMKNTLYILLMLASSAIAQTAVVGERGIVNNLGSGGVGGIGASNRRVYDWMLNPYFALPENGVSLIAGDTVTIYGDALVNVAIDNNLRVDYVCAIGREEGNNLVMETTSTDTGSYPLVMKFYNNNYLYLTDTINLVVYPKAPTGTKTILMIGNSLTNSGNEYFSAQINDALDNCTFSYVGTRGTATNHEGWSGYRWDMFSLNSLAPTYPSVFFIGGSLNIPAYFTDSLTAIPDYVLIQLGVNDIFGSCSILGDGLTSSEINTIIANAKILIDSILSADTSLKIILNIPTLCDNDGIGFDISYDISVYSQDLYINNMHKYWVNFIDTFANGHYNSRVDCSYDVIFLNRGNYPTSGVHPNAAGYTQLGRAKAIKINELLKTDLAPTNLEVLWINDYAQLIWDDNTDSTLAYEIWESKNGYAYACVDTSILGDTVYNNYTYQNANMSFKIRAISNAWVSSWSNTVSISTPLVFKTDQSTLTDVTFQVLNITSGKTINIDWGDGTNNNYTNNNTITKSYSSTQNPYFIKISGDLNYITYLNIYNQNKVYGVLTKWILPTGLTTSLYISGCYFTGDVTDWILPSGLLLFQISEVTNTLGIGFSGDVSNWIIPAQMASLNIAANPNSNKLTGDLSNWVLPSTITRFYASFQDFTVLPRGEYVNIESIIGYYVNNNNCNTAEIDDLLMDINNYFTSVTPIKNSKFILNGTGMGTPSATGLAAKEGIEAKFIAAGFTATITVNP